MKGNKTKLLTTLAVMLVSVFILLGSGISCYAEDALGGEFSQNDEDIVYESDGNEPLGGDEAPETEQAEAESGKIEQGGTENGEAEINIFEEIYSAIENNADKIFSILAFVGTVVVGACYKSGLLPLLRDALSKLKGAIDGVKADGEITKAATEGQLREISSAVESMGKELSTLKWQYESYGEIVRERESLRLLIEGQIDMLYAIFMTSALPQYQKDEVGERIAQMREELKSYESSEEN